MKNKNKVPMINVLLVEDNEPYATLMADMLYAHFSSSRLMLSHVLKLQEGIQFAKKQTFDLILLDLTLPDSEGIDTFLQIQASIPTVPIIVMTGLDDEEMALQALRYGAQDYLVKNKLSIQWLASSIRHSIERQKIERELHILAKFSEENPNPVLRVSRKGVLQYANKQSQVFLQNWGCQEGECLPAHWTDFIDRSLLSQNSIQREEDIEERTFLVTIVPFVDLDFAYLYGEDITERKKAALQLQHDALHDALTQLPNRTLFMDRLRMAIAHHQRRPNQLFAVLFLDLDHFKNINDSLGHNAGDMLLIDTASALREVLRAEDTIARMGGDEFAILLTNLQHPNDVSSMADRLLELFRSRIQQKQDILISASIGIVLSTQAHTQPENYLRDADIAMYRAKKNGRANYQIFDQQMHQQTVERIQTEIDMRHALQRKEFHLHYQPVISLQTNKIVGLEALIRWNHPTRGLISPAEFIPLAEETNLIIPITWWVLDEACRQTRNWQEQFEAYADLNISVNFSSKQFSLPNQIPHILEILEKTKLSPNHLKLEITESALMLNAEQATKTMAQLQAYHIELYMDDFGTGYSSLNYLHRFELDVLKVDRSFVTGMDTEPRKRNLIEAILQMAHNFDMKVVAEGVETNAQLTALRQLGCSRAQGYFFSKPASADEITQLLAQDPVW